MAQYLSHLDIFIDVLCAQCSIRLYPCRTQCSAACSNLWWIFSHSFGGYRHRPNAVLMRLFFRVKEFHRNNIVPSTFSLQLFWHFCVVVRTMTMIYFHHIKCFSVRVVRFASKCHYRTLIKLHCTFKYIWIKRKIVPSTSHVRFQRLSVVDSSK